MLPLLILVSLGVVAMSETVEEKSADCGKLTADMNTCAARYVIFFGFFYMFSLKGLFSLQEGHKIWR